MDRVEYLEALAKQHERFVAEGQAYTLPETVERIANLNHNLAHFWSNSGGWAPSEVATALKNARLDRMASLAESLKQWINRPALSEGDLILAWANLGSVMECILKLFLIVYLQDYHEDEEAKRTRAYHLKRNACFIR